MLAFTNTKMRLKNFINFKTGKIILFAVKRKLVVGGVVRNFETVSNNSVVLTGWQFQRCAYFVKLTELLIFTFVYVHFMLQ